jgi:hypothetical protein
MIFPDAPPYPTGRRAAMTLVPHSHEDKLSKEPSIVKVGRNTASYHGSMGASSHVDTASRRDVHATSSAGGGGRGSSSGGGTGSSGVAKNEDPSYFVQVDESQRPRDTMSEVEDDDLSLMTTHTDILRYEHEIDVEAAEFGYPILEDPVEEEFLRQSNYGEWGVHHKRS